MLEKPTHDRRESVELIAEAEEQIREMFEKGIRPVVTVKPKRAEAL